MDNVLLKALIEIEFHVRLWPLYNPKLFTIIIFVLFVDNFQCVLLRGYYYRLLTLSCAEQTS